MMLEFLRHATMANTPNSIDTFIDEQVENGVYPSVQEAQKELIGQLVEKDLDQRIANGREAAKQGKTRILSDESNKAFLKTIEKRLLAN